MKKIQLQKDQHKNFIPSLIACPKLKLLNLKIHKSNHTILLSNHKIHTIKMLLDYFHKPKLLIQTIKLNSLI